MKKFAILFLVAQASTGLILHAQVSHIFINEVYGGGGNANAPYRNDFVELYNPTEAPLDLAGWSVQYSSASGSTWSSVVLSGIIPSQGHFLIQLASGGSQGAALPAAEISGTLNISGTNGKVALVNSAVILSGACPASTSIIDLV